MRRMGMRPLQIKRRRCKKERQALPGPSWPLASHPDNVKKFVDKWMANAKPDTNGQQGPDEQGPANASSQDTSTKLQTLKQEEKLAVEVMARTQAGQVHASMMVYIHARSRMPWSLSTALSIWYKGQRPFLTRAQAQQSTELAKLHMRRYQYIASVNLQAGLLRYHVRPKGHYFMHLDVFIRL